MPSLVGDIRSDRCFFSSQNYGAGFQPLLDLTLGLVRIRCRVVSRIGCASRRHLGMLRRWHLLCAVWSLLLLLWVLVHVLLRMRLGAVVVLSLLIEATRGTGVGHGSGIVLGRHAHLGLVEGGLAVSQTGSDEEDADGDDGGPETE